MGYKEDIQIDIDHLDTELLRQASLYQRWGKREADALYQKDQVEEILSKCKAKIDLAIRADPEKFGFSGSKPTETAISSLLTLNSEVGERTEAFLKSKYTTRVLNIAVKSFEHKKKALEKLVDLYINGYWATPRVDPKAQEIFDEQAKRTITKLMKNDERMLERVKKNEEKRLADRIAKATPGTPPKEEPKPEFKPTTQTGETKAGTTKGKPAAKPQKRAAKAAGHNVSPSAPTSRIVKGGKSIGKKK